MIQEWWYLRTFIKCSCKDVRNQLCSTRRRVTRLTGSERWKPTQMLQLSLSLKLNIGVQDVIEQGVAAVTAHNQVTQHGRCTTITTCVTETVKPSLYAAITQEGITLKIPLTKSERIQTTKRQKCVSKQLLCCWVALQKNDANPSSLDTPTSCPIHRLERQFITSFVDLSTLDILLQSLCTDEKVQNLQYELFGLK